MCFSLSCQCRQCRSETMKKCVTPFMIVNIEIQNMFNLKDVLWLKTIKLIFNVQKIKSDKNCSLNSQE